MLLLGCDLGEAFDDAGRDVERRLWPLLDIAHVACGGHAGNDDSMLEAIELSLRNNVRIGAHPSYPDRDNFGRVSMAMEAEALRISLIDQIEKLDALAAARGVRLEFIKAHGALYNDAYRHEGVARTIVDAAAAIDRRMVIVCAPGSKLREEADRRGFEVLREGFADRRYQDDASLVPRSQPDALLLDVDEAAAQAFSLEVRREAISTSGKRVAIDCDILTIHSDMENSVARLSAIHRKLGENRPLYESP